MLDFHDLDTPPEEVARRLEAARRAGHPRYLWPEVPLHQWKAAARQLATAVAPALAGATVEIAPSAEAPYSAWRVALFTTGLGPLVGFWIEGGLVRAPDDLANLARLHLAHGRRRADAALGLIRDVDQALAASGVPEATILKGADTARRYFPEPGARPMTDVDLWVGAESLEATRRALRTLGYKPVSGLERPFRQEWRPEERTATLGSVFLTHGDDPIAIDLHTSLERSFAGTRVVDLGVTEPVREPRPRLGERIRGLSEPWLAAYLLLHAAEEMKHLQLVKLVELHYGLVRRTPVEWDALTSLLQVAEGEAFAWSILTLVERLIPGTVDAAHLDTLGRQVSGRIRRFVERQDPADLQHPQFESMQLRFLWARTPAEYLGGVWGLFSPRRTNAGVLGTVWQERLHRLLRGAIRWR